MREPAKVYFTSQHACFPPLIYFMYYLFSIILPADATVMYDSFATSSFAMLLYVSYCVFLAVLLFYSILKLMRRKNVEFSLAITLIVVISNIYIFGILERGNSAIIVCILLLRAMELRERKGLIAQELALLFIAMAAAIKIYPAIFGLIYLFEKKWKEAGKLILYGVLFFFLPFVPFGGFAGALQFVRNQIIIQTEVYRGMGSIHAFWNQIAMEWLHCEPKNVGTVFVVLYVLIAVLTSLLVKEVWKKIFLLSSIMIVAPFWSGRYTGIYLLVPLVLFIRQKRNGMINYVYAGLFACMFLLLTYNPGELTRLLATNFPSAIEYSAICIMNLILMIEAICNLCKKG